MQRLGHCTPTLGGHSPLCDRDGRFCSLASAHSGECRPHGRPVDDDLGWTPADEEAFENEARELRSDRGTGPDRYPTILRDSAGRITDVG